MTFELATSLLPEIDCLLKFGLLNQDLDID